MRHVVFVGKTWLKPLSDTLHSELKALAPEKIVAPRVEMIPGEEVIATLDDEARRCMVLAIHKRAEAMTFDPRIGVVQERIGSLFDLRPGESPRQMAKRIIGELGESPTRQVFAEVSAERAVELVVKKSCLISEADDLDRYVFRTIKVQAGDRFGVVAIDRSWNIFHPRSFAKSRGITNSYQLRR